MSDRKMTTKHRDKQVIEDHYRRFSLEGKNSPSVRRMILEGVPDDEGYLRSMKCSLSKDEDDHGEETVHQRETPPPHPPQRQNQHQGPLRFISPKTPRTLIMKGIPGTADPTIQQSSSIDSSKDALIEQLINEVKSLKQHILCIEDLNTSYYSSDHAQLPFFTSCGMPEKGQPASHVLERLKQIEQLDHKPRLNTSSYVNVVTEPEEQQAALLGLTTNLADGSVYPASIMVHDNVVNMLARLWNAPAPPKENYVRHSKKDKYCGAGTVGSTEACLLAGLALKFRWRKWYMKRHNLPNEQDILGIRPNIIISTTYQAAWEKFFRYFDVEPRLVKPSSVNNEPSFAVDAKELVELCDDKTICVVGILGNHYNGVYDPIWDIDREVCRINKEKGYQIGIHVDAASGGFIAPFQRNEETGEKPPPFDFRLDSVMSISASGHKFGESICGTGWVVFRQREDLAEHIAISVTYLGGKSDSITLNFSRPASACYVQAYKLLRLGKEGYRKKVTNQLRVAAFVRSCIRDMTHGDGTPRFQLLDGGDDFCLPVVAARLNPAYPVPYNDIDLQHALESCHWYVSGYGLQYENPITHKTDTLLKDVGPNDTMFRIVIKSNLTLSLAQNLVSHLSKVMPRLDKMNNIDRLTMIRVVRAVARARLTAESSTSSDSDDDEEEEEPRHRVAHTAC